MLILTPLAAGYIFSHGSAALARVPLTNAATVSMVAVLDREAFDSSVMKTYNRFSIVVSHGKGCLLWDETGKEYIDFDVDRSSQT